MHVSVHVHACAYVPNLAVLVKLYDELDLETHNLPFTGVQGTELQHRCPEGERRCSYKEPAVKMSASLPGQESSHTLPVPPHPQAQQGLLVA